MASVRLPFDKCEIVVFMAVCAPICGVDNFCWLEVCVASSRC